MNKLSILASDDNKSTGECCTSIHTSRVQCQQRRYDDERDGGCIEAPETKSLLSTTRIRVIEVEPPRMYRTLLRCTPNTSLYARMRTFFSCSAHSSCVTVVWIQGWTILCICAKSFHLQSCRSLTRPSASSTPITGTRRPPCATPPWGGMSGHLADPTPDTGYEPKFCVDVSDEHTPINFADSNRHFPQDYEATIVATTEDLNLLPHSGASSSSSNWSSHRVETRFIGKEPHESVGRS